MSDIGHKNAELLEKKQTACDHEWEYVKGWKNKIDFGMDTLEIPCKCLHCGAETEQVWTDYLYRIDVE